MLDPALFSQTAMAPKQSEKMIRLFTQSPCLPFLNDKEVKIEECPDFLLKVEQDAIHIGSRYTEGPVGMVLLRYAIEWHIWHSRASHLIALSACDLAAARAASLFLSFFCKEDQDTVCRCLPAELVDTLSWAGSTIFALEECDAYHLAYLASLRSDDSHGNPLTGDHLDIVEALAAPTEYHFAQGGDARLLINDDTRLNVYGCLPFPRNNVFTFSSSTATSVSSYAYAESEKHRQQIIQDCLESRSLQPLELHSDHVRRQIARIFGVCDAGCKIIISPSGTDSQLHAVAITSGILREPLVSIVVAADETGSGTPLSVTGKHFGDLTCLGTPVRKGETLAGMPEIAYQAEPLRDATGRLRSAKEMDDAVWQAVSEAVRRGYSVLLHVMDQSKLGCWSPSLELIDNIQIEFGESVQVIVDACQARIDSVDIRRYLLNGYIVLLTGSKFYTGPPFSGAALFPESLIERAESTDNPFPEGLVDYLPKSDLGGWPQPPSASPRYNGIGMYLRWWAALVEVDRYQEVPEGLRRLGLDLFCQRAERILREAKFIELVFDADDAHYAKKGVSGTELSCRRTILPFRILHEDDYLDATETARVYELLNRDISNLITGAAEDLRLAARGCHIGQPVKIPFEDNRASAVLRISAGARIVSESWLHRDAGMYFKKVEEETDQIEFIVQKVGLIVTRGLHRR